MNDKLAIPDDTRHAQARAADPTSSVWVSANAGAGKTFVLTRRVLRLLLAGVKPDEILCLTYTKAAAAEMRGRVAKALGEWALMADEALVAELASVTGQPPDRVTFERARLLFAQALETPGGLKINTIHAFCEAVLHRFPLEAGLPFDFTVIEDAEKAGLVHAARQSVLADGLNGDVALTEAVETLFAAASDTRLEDVLDAALAFGPRLTRALSDPARAEANLRNLLGLSAQDDAASIAKRITGDAIIPHSEFAGVAAHLDHLGGSKTLAGKFAAESEMPESPEAVFAAFLTKADLAAPKNENVTAALQKSDPDLADRIRAETGRVAGLVPVYAAATAFERSRALMSILKAVLERYEAMKRGRALVDFDDLIDKLRDLLTIRSVGAWVSYKLDAAITHILVDESQDTNPEQWDIVSALTEEFFSGDSAVQKPRTVFAVGDEKQSIFSFQGAAPHLFAETGKRLAARAADAGARFERLELKTSFRTVSTVLSAVDRVFAAGEAHAGLEADPRPTRHIAARTDRGGRVELWPLAARAEAPEELDHYPTEPIDMRSPERRLAADIVARIGVWLAERRPLAGRGRAITPGDVMILAQKRGTLFHEIIRALKQAGIPNAGADRLSVTSHIAVEDLLALGDVLINPGDDLNLATVLRSPLFGISEAALEALCAGRGDRTVWRQLGELAQTEDWAAAAHARLRAWRARLDRQRPYDFFARLLFAEGGIKQFHARLGIEVDDVLNEFLDMALDHERTRDPSMVAFIAGLRQTERGVKRELSEAGDTVRVMTIHGAKGLEAPVVILADAADVPAGRNLAHPVAVNAPQDDPSRHFVLWLGGGKGCAPIDMVKQARRDAEFDEYRRKLYVALTRAEDELYLTGKADKDGGAPAKSWYGLVKAGLLPHGEETHDAEGRPGLVFAGSVGAQEAGQGGAIAGSDPAPLPGWLTEPAPAPLSIPVVSPSLAGDHDLRTAGGTGDAEAARRRGIAVHALLNQLPAIDPAERGSVARKALGALLPDQSEAHEALIDKALGLIEHPPVVGLFGPQSRGEVTISADLSLPQGPVRLSGRIDRLIDSSTLTIIDFKSDAAPPDDGIPAAYLTQLALYRAALEKSFPGRAVSAGILWVETGAVIMANAPEMDAVTNSFTPA
ncbi:double-strand break repair helicase AddA [Cucumibacter marinus]|uniref:double-strand break repair helicase AddA n=1 Tax=Cucumibacter marinus TaxID=1121252 RepID=UPI0003F69968|nr:double-strand break repair helicase AddA [Cucumibacter marinus]